MGVKSVQLSSTGFIPNTSGLGLNIKQQLPEFILIQTSDTLATVLVSGYLNVSRTYFQFPYNNWQMALVYCTDVGPVWLKVVVTGSGTSSVYSLAYPSESAASGVTYTGSLTVGNLTSIEATTGVIQDSGIVANNVVLTTGTSNFAPGSDIVLDKGTGTVSGGSVTINNNAGVITTTSLTTAGGASTSFTLSNSLIISSSVVLVTVKGGTNTTTGYSISASAGTRSSTITINNTTAATAFNGTFIISFVVL